MTMTLKIGRRLTVEVADFAEASTAYASARDESGEGASTFPAGVLTGTGTYRVSYNGKIWDGLKPWSPGDEPLFNPYTAEA